MAHNSNVNNLAVLIRTLRRESDVFVVDNSTVDVRREEILSCCGENHANYYCCYDNVGIARGQNIGISRARAAGCNFFLLMDDDSFPAEDMLRQLTQTWTSRGGETSKIVVCAQVVSELPTVAAHALAPTPEPIPIREMMSSGTLIPGSILDLVGEMDEGLFIDLVDYDWGWRAKAVGVAILRVPNAKLLHSLGMQLGLPFGFHLNVPSPTRHYYQFRNLVLVWRRPYVSFAWKFCRLLLTPLKLFAVVLLAGSGLRRIQLAARGIFDGLSRSSGRGPFFNAGAG